MSKYSLSELTKYIGGNLYGKDKLVSSFSIDSRTISNGDVYICLKGKNYDGHDFIKDCIKKSSCIITSQNIENINLSEISYIKVSNTLKALQDLSQYVRNKSNAKFIAITGSNGKTTVKEMIAHILSDYKITYTKGNLNNHIGVPLTLLSINQDEDYVIVEIGSNNLGEIEPLARIVKPDVAAVTNIGYAHIEGFKNLNNTAKEKFSLFKHIQKDGHAIINNQDKFRNIIKKGNKFGIIKFGSRVDLYMPPNYIPLVALG
jgi:UDP-N-acetylmuramoyl-tripeptide--D-alanyl-D-alanine ligase